MSSTHPTLSELLCWIGFESQTASDHMQELCKRCGVAYPPGSDGFAPITAPSLQSQQQPAHA